jgi:hypothetical protein
LGGSRGPRLDSFAMDSVRPMADTDLLDLRAELDSVADRIHCLVKVSAGRWT